MAGGVEVVQGAGAVRVAARPRASRMLAFAVIVWGCVGPGHRRGDAATPIR